MNKVMLPIDLVEYTNFLFDNYSRFYKNGIDLLPKNNLRSLGTNAIFSLEDVIAYYPIILN